MSISLCSNRNISRNPLPVYTLLEPCLFAFVPIDRIAGIIDNECTFPLWPSPNALTAPFAAMCSGHTYDFNKGRCKLATMFKPATSRRVYPHIFIQYIHFRVPNFSTLPSTPIILVPGPTRAKTRNADISRHRLRAAPSANKRKSR